MNSNKARDENSEFISDIRNALTKNLGDDDFASMLEILVADTKRIAQILCDEGFAIEEDFRSLSFGE